MVIILVMVVGGRGGGCSMFEENPVLNDLNEHDF